MEQQRIRDYFSRSDFQYGKAGFDRYPGAKPSKTDVAHVLVEYLQALPSPFFNPKDYIKDVDHCLRDQANVNQLVDPLLRNIRKRKNKRDDYTVFVRALIFDAFYTCLRPLPKYAPSGSSYYSAVRSVIRPLIGKSTVSKKQAGAMGSIDEVMATHAFILVMIGECSKNSTQMGGQTKRPILDVFGERDAMLEYLKAIRGAFGSKVNSGTGSSGKRLGVIEDCVNYINSVTNDIDKRDSKNNPWHGHVSDQMQARLKQGKYGKQKISTHFPSRVHTNFVVCALIKLGQWANFVYI